MLHQLPTLEYRADLATEMGDSMFFLILFVFAVALNYAWELAQLDFYAGTGGLPEMWLHCFKSSLVDGLLVMLIFGAGALIFRERSWCQRMTFYKWVFIFLAGFVVGVGVEWIGFRVLKRWEYGESMPIIPIVGVGLVPILQMLILPPLVFWIAQVVQSKIESRGKRL